MRIKKGDTVQAIAGASSGKTGKVLQVIRETNRIVVEGLNLRKKHTRAKKQGQKGQVIEFPASMHWSNAMIVCPKCGKPARIALVRNKDEKPARTCKKCNQAID